MRKIVLVGLLALLVGAAQAQDVGDAQSKANFYAQNSDGECGLEFTIEATGLLTGLDPKPFIACIAQTDALAR